MKKLSHAQLDLFVIVGPVVELSDTERQMAVALLQALLTEAIVPAIASTTVPTSQEAGNE
jgi:hypothetical protein